MSFKRVSLILLAATFIPTGVVLSNEPEKAPKPKQTVTEKIKEQFVAFKKWMTVERFCCGALAIAAMYFGYQHVYGTNGNGNGNGQGNGRPPQGPPEIPCAHNYSQRLQDVPNNRPEVIDQVNIPVVIAAQQPNQPDRPVQILVQQRRTVSQAPRTDNFKGHACGFHTAVNLTLGSRAEAAAPNQQAQAWQEIRNHNIVGARVERAGQIAEQVVNGQVPLNNGMGHINPEVAAGLANAGNDNVAERQRAQWGLVDRNGDADVQLIAHLLEADRDHCPVGNHMVVHFDAYGRPQEFDVNRLRVNGIHRVDFHDRAQVHHFGVVINRQGNNVRYIVLDSVNGAIMRGPAVRQLIGFVEFGRTDHIAADGVSKLMERATHPQLVGHHANPEYGVVTDEHCNLLRIRMPANPVAPQPQPAPQPNPAVNPQPNPAAQPLPAAPGGPQVNPAN